MQTVVTSERQFTIAYHKPRSDTQYGISVTVSGDKKAKVLRDARDLLEQAQKDALEVYKQFLGDEPKSEE